MVRTRKHPQTLQPPQGMHMPQKLGLSDWAKLRCPFLLSRAARATYFEKADACVTRGRCEVLIIIKVNIAQVPGVRELLPAPIKHPRTAQVPAWQRDSGSGE